MRFARTLSLYVMREALVYCTLTFLVLTLVLLTQNLLRRLDELFLVGLTLSDIGVVVRHILPIALSYSIPLAFLIGMLLAVRRLSSDGELLALRSSGLGPNAFLVPFVLLGFCATLFSGWLLHDVEHQSRRELVKLFKRAAARGALVEPGKFRHIGAHLVFVEARERDGRLSGVMLYDQSRKDRRFRVFAAHGQLEFDAEAQVIQLDLKDGDIHLDPRTDAPNRYERMRFDTFSYRLDVGHLIGTDFWPVRPKQMTVPELRAVLARAERGDPLRELDEKDPLEYALEIHRRSALPFAPLLFAGLGVPIALASEHRRRNLGLFTVLIAAFGYYALGAVCESLALNSWVGPATAQWIPNAVFGSLALVLIVRGRNRIPR
jgi:lipopolysaccharide export system permease protein